MSFSWKIGQSVVGETRKTRRFLLSAVSGLAFGVGLVFLSVQAGFAASQAVPPAPSAASPTVPQTLPPTSPPSATSAETSASLDKVSDETIKRLEKEAKSGNNASAILLGQYYEEKNQDEATKWYALAADNASMDAINHLLAMAQKRKDLPSLKKWLAKAASMGSVNAEFQLGDILTSDATDRKDAGSGVAYLQKAADANLPQAMQRLSSLYLSGVLSDALPKDAAKAYQLEMRAAKLQYAPAIMGLYFFLGAPDLTTEEKKEAVDFLKGLLGQENPVAEDVLGMAMVSGHGVEKNPSRGAELVRRAAEAEFVPAEADMGYLFRNGIGVEQDDRMANIWYGKAAARGNIDAFYNLGIAVLAGKGEEKNVQRGLSLIAKAASMGDARAALTLSDFFANGDNGLPKDPEKAAKIVEFAAKLGLPEAEYRAGLLYQNGLGVTKDAAKAKEFFDKAARDGYAPAKDETAPAGSDGKGQSGHPSQAASPQNTSSQTGATQTDGGHAASSKESAATTNSQ